MFNNAQYGECRLEAASISSKWVPLPTAFRSPHTPPRSYYITDIGQSRGQALSLAWCCFCATFTQCSDMSAIVATVFVAFVTEGALISSGWRGRRSAV